MNSALLAKDLHICVDLSTSKILWNSELHIIKGVLTSKKENPSKKNLKMQIKEMWIIRERAMAAHSSALAWKVPWMEGPGR